MYYFWSLIILIKLSECYLMLQSHTNDYGHGNTYLIKTLSFISNNCFKVENVSSLLLLNMSSHCWQICFKAPTGLQKGGGGGAYAKSGSQTLVDGSQDFPEVWKLHLQFSKLADIHHGNLSTDSEGVRWIRGQKVSLIAALEYLLY